MLTKSAILHDYHACSLSVLSLFNDCLLRHPQLVNQCMAFQLEQQLSQLLFIQSNSEVVALSGDHFDKIGRSQTFDYLFSHRIGTLLLTIIPGQLGFTLGTSDLVFLVVLWSLPSIVMENYGPTNLGGSNLHASSLQDILQLHFLHLKLRFKMAAANNGNYKLHPTSLSLQQLLGSFSTFYI